MWNAFDRLLRRLVMTEERISEFKDMPIEISRAEKEQRLKKAEQNIQELWDNYM